MPNDNAGLSGLPRAAFENRAQTLEDPFAELPNAPAFISRHAIVCTAASMKIDADPLA